MPAVMPSIGLLAELFAPPPGTYSEPQRQAIPKAQDKLALGENEVNQLMLLMDTDENAKISRQEWMKFMEAEFDGLDKDKKGQLDCQGTRAIEVACKPPRGQINRELVVQPAWSAFLPHRVLLEVVHEGQADSGSSE